MKMTGNNHDRFWVFIDDRRLPSFKPRPGLHRRPVFGTIGCSFDCWCKGTKIFGIYQIFACDKERFSAKYLRFETSLKTDSISYGAHLYVFAVSKTMFFGINQHITK